MLELGLTLWVSCSITSIRCSGISQAGKKLLTGFPAGSEQGGLGSASAETLVGRLHLGNVAFQYAWEKGFYFLLVVAHVGSQVGWGWLPVASFWSEKPNKGLPKIGRKI